MSKLLITGARGFIGKNLIKSLEKDGNDFIVFKGNITREEDFTRVDNKIDKVIHLAAKVSCRSKKKIEQVNVRGTENVIKFCQENKVKKLIFLSSIRVLSESSDPYIDSKRKAEELVKNSGVPHVIIRPSLVYGPGDRKNIGAIINMAKKSTIMPVFNFNMQPVYIDDLIKVIVYSLSIQENKELNIVGQEIIKYIDILNILKSLGLKLKTINMPEFFAAMLKFLSLTSFLPMPYWQVKTLLVNETYKGDAWPEQFKIRPTLFKDGIREVIKSYG